MDLPEKHLGGFVPMLRGCVAPSARTARTMDALARLALEGVVANTDRSLIFEDEGALAEHFDALASEWLSYFRLMGRLALALGGASGGGDALRVNRRRRGRMCEEMSPEMRCAVIRESAQELRLWCTQLQAQTSRCQDRIVCALLEMLAHDAERLAVETERFLR